MLTAVVLAGFVVRQTTVVHGLRVTARKDCKRIIDEIESFEAGFGKA